MKMRIKSFFKDNFIPPKKLSNRINSEGRFLSSANSRLEFIDLAKGICIILVVLFHSEIGISVPNFDALRMPLYFILSGLFFRDYGGLRFLIVKKINKLVIPFVFFYVISFIVMYLIQHIFKGGGLELDRFWDPFVDKEIVNLPLWFLMCLFWCNVLYAIISLTISKQMLRICMVCIIASIGFLIGSYHIFLPMYLCSAMISLPFFYGGVILGNSRILYPNKYDKYLLPISIVFLCFAYTIFFFCDKPAPTIRILDTSWYNSVILAYINSFLMVIGVLMLCKFIRWIPVISYIGRYSIIVLVTHYIIIVNLAEVVELIIGVALSPFESFVYTLLICWLLIPLFRKYLPYVTAQREVLDLQLFRGGVGINVSFNSTYIKSSGTLALEFI